MIELGWLVIMRNAETAGNKVYYCILNIQQVYVSKALKKDLQHIFALSVIVNFISVPFFPPLK